MLYITESQDLSKNNWVCGTWHLNNAYFFFIVKPFANEEEYKKTEAIVQKFQNGIGEKLQKKLLERAKGKRNWVFMLFYL